MKTYLIWKVRGGGGPCKRLNQKNLPRAVFAIPGPPCGKLPGKSLEDSQGIRDILWRWYSPHVEGLWVDLPTNIDEFH